ncbi:hypothetical protein A7N05_19125 [Acinetobacter baumannii]|nr:hypothetical protein [Acinetobacter baumannii]OIH77899.1 hypothetical protein A7N05_19125 [Acinetobacter baumannii]
MFGQANPVSQADTTIAIHPVCLQFTGPVTGLKDFSTGHSYQKQENKHTPHDDVCAVSQLLLNLLIAEIAQLKKL